MQPPVTIELKIILEHPTPGVDFGLQKGSGSQYETVQLQRSTGKNLLFTCTINVKDNGADFSGPFVQGPKGTRFLYIDIGACAGQKGTPWSRRLKIPLTISGAVPGQVFQTTVPGTGKDGGPNCATVKPFSGWTAAG